MEQWKQKVLRMETVNKKKMKKSRLGWVIASMSILGLSGVIAPGVALATLPEKTVETIAVTETATTNSTEEIKLVDSNNKQVINIETIKETAKKDLTEQFKIKETEISELQALTAEQKNEAKTSLSTKQTQFTKDILTLSSEQEITDRIKLEKEQLSELLVTYQNLNEENQKIVTETTKPTTEQSKDEVKEPAQTLQSEEKEVTKEAPKMSARAASAPVATERAIDNSYKYPEKETYKHTVLPRGSRSTSLNIPTVEGFTIGSKQVAFNLTNSYPETFTPNKMYAIGVTINGVTEWYNNYGNSYDIKMTGTMQYAITPRGQLEKILASKDSYNPNTKISIVLQYRSSDDIKYMFSDPITPKIVDPYITTEREKMKERVTNSVDLTETEKKQLLAQIDGETLNDRAQTDQFVKKYNDLIDKSEAKNRLTEKSTEIKAKIDQFVGISAEEKEQAKAEIDKLLTTGLEKIEAAENATDVETQENSYKDQMDTIYKELEAKDKKNMEQAKEKATADLTKKADEAKAIIDGLSNLSTEEKTKQKLAVDKELEVGTKAINDATTPEEIKTAQTTGEGNIDKVVTDSELQDAKNKAKKELEEKATLTKAAIDKLTGVSAEEKEKAKSEIEKVLEAGKKAIDDADKTDAVTTQTTEHKDQMDTIYNNLSAENDKNIEQAKEKATAELTKKAEEAKIAIDALPNLSTEEKAKQKAEVDKDLEAGTKAINEATTPEGITTAQTKGENNIEKEVKDSELQDAKNKGKKELEDKAKSTKDAIDKLVGLSDEEKAKGKAEIDKLLETGLTNIQKSENETDAGKELTTSKGQMDDVYNGLVTDSNKNIEQAKEKATAELTKKAEEAKKISVI
ncbi:DUF1542 domain-containing protein [Vagococcus hydrophili]|uniref:DUF1542 domain-containing protein n=1 Tax=Vagococcus hydrophili TaxID=2714947 RepID=A0A6G8ATI5_9ENTE|nr:DUF1542 domain-containing protein [Vagococcus hydrophili]QIL48290.1 DUF1542 domain-containing protein [Vagococcus hydrophili]